MERHIRLGLTITNAPQPQWSEETVVKRESLEAVLGSVRARGSLELLDGNEVLALQLINEGREPVSLARFLLRWELPLGIPATAGLRIAYCGAHSRSTMSRSYVAQLDDGAALESWWVGALAGPRRGAVMAAVDFTTFVSSVRMSRAFAETTIFLEQWTLRPGETLAVPPVWMSVTDDHPFEALERYASLVGRRHGFTPRNAACGWGSWGHFLERIDAGIMRETVLAIDGSTALREAIRVVQIDDGWSELLDSGRVSASWRPNRRFESGIAPLAAEITRSGRDCGLWILPFTVNQGADLAEAHPELLVRDASGGVFRVGGGESFCVDPTHPGGREWLEDVFEQIHQWGVRYVKLDFLRALLAPDPDVVADCLDVPRIYHGAQTRAQAYREGLRVVREALGERGYVVGCSAPIGASAGLVDAQRIGPDIEPTWDGRHSGIRDAVCSLASNWFWHGRAWNNDPDYLVASVSMEETRFWATAVALSGGAVVISADFHALTDWQERIFTLVTPPTGRSARPLDLFKSFQGPRLWRIEDPGPAGTWTILGVFNWAERPVETVLRLDELGLPARSHVWNVWRGRHRISDGEIVVPLAAHDAAILAIRPDTGIPAVIGTDIHFSLGSMVLKEERWDGKAGTLEVAAMDRLPRDGNLFLHVPGFTELQRIRIKAGGRQTFSAIPRANG